jgi:signal transduction histidine kinase
VSAPGPSLVNRVALGAALAAALAGGVAAAAAGIAARELVASHEESALRAAVTDMRDELREDDEDESSPPERDMDQRLLHELDDLKLAGARAALIAHGRVVAGDGALPALDAGSCREQDEPGKSLRLCALPFQDATLVLAVPRAAEHARSALITRALWFGLWVGALLGGLFSYFVARWALAPLTALRDRVRAVDGGAPEVAPLSPRAAHAEVEELRAAIAGLVERLSASLSHAQAFAAEAAHELRTPLTTIAGELELMSEGDASEPAALARVRAQVADLIALVQRLLVLAQPETQAVRGLEAVDLGDVASAALSALLPPLRARVEAQIEDDVLVRGEPTLLRALLSNALDNALKFSQEPVTLHIRKDHDSAQIDVRDRGPGVAEAERERVFAPFYRAAGARARGTQGHGLGLALIAKVAALHGGRARFAEAAPGAHLSIRIPSFQRQRREAQVAS